MKKKHGAKVSNNTENQTTIFICKSIYKMNFLLIQQTSKTAFLHISEYIPGYPAIPKRHSRMHGIAWHAHSAFQ